MLERFSEYYFSNGVRNVLADVFGFFDFSYADEVVNEDKTGWIGVIRRPVKDVWAIDQTGVLKRYDNDYVSHFYTDGEGVMISHSTSCFVNNKPKINGLIHEEITDYIGNITSYYLRINLPPNRVK